MRFAWVCSSLALANGFLPQTFRPPRSKHTAPASALRLSIDSSSPPVSASDSDGLVVGLNKYSHDSSVCILSYRDGTCLFAGEKERLTRAKHDGGDTGELVSHALRSVGASLEDVRLVVSNNHHHRVAPFEERVPWAVAQGTYPASYASEENLIPGAAHAELSHHLAHAWSAAALSPFDSGLIVVMDGMGESHGAMARAEAEAVAREEYENARDVDGQAQQQQQQQRQGERPPPVEYYNDLRLMRELGAGGEMAEGTEVPGDGSPGFQQVPEELLPHEAYREAESAYQFMPGADGGPTLVPIYKRWIRERSPPELFNHGFENMESMGAVYSRVSSHIFGDWNACGKVMGLAPYASKSSPPAAGELPPPPRLTSGSLLLGGKGGGGTGEDAFYVDWEAIESLPRPNGLGQEGDGQDEGDDGSGNEDGLHGLGSFYAALASRAQEGLEEAALEFVKGLRDRTGEENVCLCGGVALNSVLNGKIAREAGFRRVFVPPCPGDEGVAVGCASFGWHQRRLLLPSSGDTTLSPTDKKNGDPTAVCEEENLTDTPVESGGGGDLEGRPKVVAGPLGSGELRTPYWGRGWTEDDVEDEIAEWERWVDVRQINGVEEVAQAIADGKVVAWFQGRGEFGPRALGSRSLLADPRDPEMPARINADVKKREDFRPFAPSVLAEEAEDWFEGLPPDGSPYMSLTAPAKPGVAERVPAVCHVDWSSRLQTVTEESSPLYHRLITAFFKMTGVPMVLNTSFNVMGEPIVDSPQDAIRSLHGSGGAIGMLVLHDRVLTAKPFPPDAARDSGEDGEGEFDEEEAWSGMTPVQAVGFRSEVTESSDGEILRARVQPTDGQEKWIELGEMELDLLELADRSLSLTEMMEEVVEERLSRREEDDDEEGSDGGEEEDGVGSDGEDMEGLAIEAVRGEVLGALRSLYQNRLVAFED
ncbi:conserved unknown protein [Ectocarpus siliculosus]|uniref:Carbamoyltransferase n=1 Tax=Ectocarpus siliculosus TaxID=2880 RepID=D7G3R1_ECTSI|nr:conserved unknown protein [Ectocarpus siliculosus]|eukprot:CBJ33588.1 conserved unknown protein [Ectocarpus siliculosus]